MHARLQKHEEDPILALTLTCSVGGDYNWLCAKSSLSAHRQQLDGTCEGPF